MQFKMVLFRVIEEDCCKFSFERLEEYILRVSHKKNKDFTFFSGFSIYIQENVNG